MDIKKIFEQAENGVLTYEQFSEIAKANEAKFADLASGKYVSKSKYEDDLRDAQTKYDEDVKSLNTTVETLNSQIENLNQTITTRDTDLSDLQKQLEAAGQDATKLTDLTAQFTALQQKYDTDTQNYQNQMRQQAYEFAVKEFANTKRFSSQAAKRDFTQAMISKGLQMEGNKLIGGEDFVEMYSADNADAFYVEPEPTPEPPKPEPEPEPIVEPTPVPTITASATGPVADDNENGFSFNFTGVRAR